MDLAFRVWTRHLLLMERTLKTINHLFAIITLDQATTLRDGDDGWTPLEVLCHLRDFDEIFYQRAWQIIKEDEPTLTPVDHLALAQARAYNAQAVDTALATLNASRRRFIDDLRALTDESTWERAAFHPESGRITLLDQLMQVGHHDMDHIEQISRMIAEG